MWHFAQFALSVALDVILGGGGSTWEEPALRIFAAPWTILPFALSIILVGPLEEFGWRGYVLDRLQDRWSALTSSLILGVFNLIPLAPLDGEKIFDYFLPPAWSQAMDRIRPYGPLILMALLFVVPYFFHFDVLGAILGPPMRALIGLLIG